MSTGDHPVAQFEQGTKLGGNYKCACGCQESLFVTGFGKTLHKGPACDSCDVFLVPQIEIYESPDFVIYMSNNPSSCAIQRQNKPSFCPT